MNGVLDPNAFAVHRFDARGAVLAYIRERPGGVPLLLVHGWPETKRIWWRVIAPLAAAGFEVIVPDLRGYGDSDVAPDGLSDVASHSRDLHALVHDHLGLDRVVVAGGDLGGLVIQDLSLRYQGFVDRMVVFNTGLPYDRERMAGMRTRAPTEAGDYFVRQGTDADALAGELDTPERRRRYVATFYTARLWAHPGAFLEQDAGGTTSPPAARGRYTGSSVVDFHTEPFADGAKLRASFGAYESLFDERARSELMLMRPNPGSTPMPGP